MKLAIPFLFMLLLVSVLAGCAADDDDDNNSVDDDLDDDTADDDAAPDDDSTIDDDTAPDDDTTLEPPTVKSLTWIRSTDGRLIDEYGRQWLLYGINARVTGLFDGDEYWTQATAVYEQWDAQRMAFDGFNLFRLPINWSAIEPVEGQFSEDYLQQMEQVIAWARDAGLYVLVDFHQDKFSKFIDIGDDGAPKWAVFPPPDEKIEVSLQFLLAVDAFFNNHEAIQDRFLPAWQLVVSRFADQPNVIGFEIMNEPITVFLPFGQQKLYSFYEKVTTAMREVDTRHAIWMEPDVYRNQFLWAPLRDEPFPDDNVVYEPHMYPNFIGMNYQTVPEWIDALTATFDHILPETQSWGAAPVIGEWGTHPNDSFAPALFEAIQKLADERSIGLAFWVWKEKASGNWGLFDYDGETETWTERTGSAIDALLRPRVMAVPGRLLSTRFDTATNELSATFEAAGGEGPPLLYLPQSYYPNGVAVQIDGASIEIEIDPTTQRTLLPWNGETGAHEITVVPQ